MEKARMDPTEKSMPPMTITAVIPIARIPKTVTWSKTFSRFRNERKALVAKENTTPSTTSPIKGPCTPMSLLAKAAPRDTGGEIVGAAEAPSFDWEEGIMKFSGVSVLLRDRGRWPPDPDPRYHNGEKFPLGSRLRCGRLGSRRF